MHVAHISTVHRALDPRIRNKQIRTLTDAGCKVTFISGDLDAELAEDFRIIRVYPGRSTRFIRMLITAPRAILKAWKVTADVYHFHDPELIPWVWILLIKRRPIVYDIHEDFKSGLRQKGWIPRLLRQPVASILSWLEKVGTLPFDKIIAERYYLERFPKAIEILNYPILQTENNGIAFKADSTQLLYTGNVTSDRGAINIATTLRKSEGLSITTVGHCPANLAKEMRLVAGENAEKLNIVGEKRYVPFTIIKEHYSSRSWLAGLALFPNTPHYRQKELTKFFEYMSVGLPIIASDFPAWRRLIVEQGVGLCVDADNPNAVLSAVDWLRTHPEESKKMAKRGMHLAKTCYNWNKEGERLLNFYATLLQK